MQENRRSDGELEAKFVGWLQHFIDNGTMPEMAVDEDVLLTTVVEKQLDRSEDVHKPEDVGAPSLEKGSVEVQEVPEGMDVDEKATTPNKGILFYIDIYVINY